jgi:hypothetical protein
MISANDLRCHSASSESPTTTNLRALTVSDHQCDPDVFHLFRIGDPENLAELIEGEVLTRAMYRT